MGLDFFSCSFSINVSYPIKFEYHAYKLKHLNNIIKYIENNIYIVIGNMVLIFIVLSGTCVSGKNFRFSLSGVVYRWCPVILERGLNGRINGSWGRLVVMLDSRAITFSV